MDFCVYSSNSANLQMQDSAFPETGMSFLWLLIGALELSFYYSSMKRSRSQLQLQAFRRTTLKMFFAQQKEIDDHVAAIRAVRAHLLRRGR